MQRIILFCLLITVGQFATVIYLPSMPVITQQLHASDTVIQLTLTLYMLTFGLSQLIYGPLSDVVGRKRLMIAGMVLYILSSLASAVAMNGAFLLVARLFEGLGAGGITSLTRASVNDHYTGAKLTHVLSYTAIAASLTSMFAPVIGGFMQSFFNWRANFIFLVIWTLLMLLLTLWRIQDKHQPQPAKHLVRDSLQTYAELFRHREFVLNVLAGGLAFSGITGYYVASPFLFQQQLHLSPHAYGLTFLGSSGAFVLGSMMNRHVHQETVRRYLGIVILLGSSVVLLIPALLGILTFWWFLLPAMGYMVGAGIIYPTCMASAVRLFKKRAGTAAAVFGCMQVCCAALATAVVAVLLHQTQTGYAGFVTVVSFMVVILIIIAVHHHKTPQNF